MALSEIFNQGYEAEIAGDCALRVEWGVPTRHGLRNAAVYDFALRQTMTYSYGTPVGVTPFSQVDREVLETMRERLIRLGGHPPELPAVGDVQAPKPGAPGLQL
jgi:hypothetical protein